MTKYIPFLKMKQNEIHALSELSVRTRASLMPFFDIPRPKELTAAQIVERLRIARKCADEHLRDLRFYLDSFDLGDEIELDGKPQYSAILENFEDFDVIAVTGLDRSIAHTEAAFNRAALTNRTIAIRLTSSDIESYKLSLDQLNDIYHLIEARHIETIHVILDFRYINRDIEFFAERALSFIAKMDGEFKIDVLIVTGSSIPANVTDVLKSKTSMSLPRNEWKLWKTICERNTRRDTWTFGDYGVISPDYTDMEFDFRMVQNVATPKVFYTYADAYFAVRGGSFKSHPSKYGQYFLIADLLVDQPFFRKREFSFGEQYIYERSFKSLRKPAKAGSPSTWLKATLCTHMTFIVESI